VKQWDSGTVGQVEGQREPGQTMPTATRVTGAGAQERGARTLVHGTLAYRTGVKARAERPSLKRMGWDGISVPAL
jgi:hypothetical protein